MGILDRVNRIVRSNVNSLLERAEDPQKTLDLHIEEMRGGVTEARQEVVRLATSERLARRKYEECMAESRRWEERAMAALRQGDETLARRALTYKHEIDSKGSDLLRQAELHAEYVQQLKDQLVMLERKSELANQRARQVAARRAAQQVHAARARQRAERAPRPIDTSALEDRAAFDAFDRMDDRVSQLDAEMEAMAELNADLFDPGRVELEQRFAELESDRNIEDSLSALKGRLNR